ncbi:hypothetical protein [Actinacidiphila sp. bgisy144]|uniref:hypothetical protein n=1 Tax=unclassified Actinacidiphila TaxID=2995708 RepID=UPI003EBE27F0
MTWDRPLLADRAKHLLAAACGQAGSGVLLPALYCAEVAEDIEAAGVPVRVYDLGADLAPVRLPTDDRFRTLVWHQPFGRWLPPPPRDDLTVIQDACFGLRTALGMAAPPAGPLVVFSPRKEFLWPEGGLAVGGGAARLRGAVGADASVGARWDRLDRAAEVARGLAADRAARTALGPLLPPRTVASEVLTLLPLLSATRDATIDRLRAKGVGAWCWQRPMPGCTADATPGARWLWERLVFVPTPAPGSPVYPLLAAQDFEPWPA